MAFWNEDWISSIRCLRMSVNRISTGVLISRICNSSINSLMSRNLLLLFSGMTMMLPLELISKNPFPQLGTPYRSFASSMVQWSRVVWSRSLILSRIA